MKLSRKETFIIIFAIIIPFLMSGWDIVEDLYAGSTIKHLIIESLIMVSTFVAIYILIRKFLINRKILQNLNKKLNIEKKTCDHWKKESNKFINGLSQIIEKQYDYWHLSNSEKDVSSFLLKGLSLHEIAEIRQTKEATVRLQASSIYKKSNLRGRHELSAFFLEDLLPQRKEASH
jgi:DNA-binding CsgD family transcriptional regulator